MDFRVSCYCGLDCPIIRTYILCTYFSAQIPVGGGWNLTRKSCNRLPLYVCTFWYRPCSQFDDDDYNLYTDICMYVHSLLLSRIPKLARKQHCMWGRKNLLLLITRIKAFKIMIAQVKIVYIVLNFNFFKLTPVPLPPRPELSGTGRRSIVWLPVVVGGLEISFFAVAVLTELLQIVLEHILDNNSLTFMCEPRCVQFVVVRRCDGDIHCSCHCHYHFQHTSSTLLTEPAAPISRSLPHVSNR